MSLSGINIDNSIVQKYEDMRLAKSENQRGLVLKIDEDKIVIDYEANSDFEELKEVLPDAEPRYVIYDVPIKNRANLDDLRTIFLVWMPMESPVRQRMMYSSTKSVITSNFRGIATNIQEEEKDRLTMEYLKNKINKTQGINNPTYRPS